MFVPVSPMHEGGNGPPCAKMRMVALPHDAGGALWEHIQKLRFQQGDPGEHVRFQRTELPGTSQPGQPTDHAVSVEFHRTPDQGIRVGPDHHGGQCAHPAVRGQDQRQIQVRHQLGIDHCHGPAGKKTRRSLDPAPGAQDLGLLAGETHRHAGRLPAHRIFDHLGHVVGVDHHLGDTGAGQERKGVSIERCITNRQERLGPLLPNPPQPRPKAGGQHHPQHIAQLLFRHSPTSRHPWIQRAVPSRTHHPLHAPHEIGEQNNH